MIPAPLINVSHTVLWSPLGKSWIKALYLVGNGSGLTIVGGNTVTQWNDTSGFGLHATVPGGGSAMPYVAADSRAGGRPTIGPVDYDLMNSLVTPSITAARVYMVTTYKTGAESSFALFPQLFSGPGASGQYRVVAQENTATLSTASNFSNTARKNGNAASATVLPMPLSVLVSISTTPRTQTFSILHEVGRAKSWEGACRAFVLTNGTESDADRDRLAGFLAHNSGIQGSLAAGHPYRVNHP